MNPLVSEFRTVTNGIFKSSSVSHDRSRGSLNFPNRESSSSTSRSPSHSLLSNYPPETMFDTSARKVKVPDDSSSTDCSSLTSDMAASALNSILILFSDIEARDVIQVRKAFYAVDPKFVETELVDVVLTSKGGGHHFSVTTGWNNSC